MGGRPLPFNALPWLRDNPMIEPAGWGLFIGHRHQAWRALRVVAPAVWRVGFNSEDGGDKSTI